MEKTGNSPSDPRTTVVTPLVAPNDEQTIDTNLQELAQAPVNVTLPPEMENQKYVCESGQAGVLEPANYVSDKANNTIPPPPPATPITNGNEPLNFPSPILDHVTLTTADTESVSNPSSEIKIASPSAEAVSELAKIATEAANMSVEAISVPILEAATIANAVAGISITDPITPTRPVDIPITPITFPTTPTAVSSSGLEALEVVINPAMAPIIGCSVNPEISTSSTISSTSIPIATAAENGAKNCRDEEVELLRARVQTLQAELVAALSKPGTKNHTLVETIKQQHEELLNKARGMLFDKTKIVKNQELQISALTAQVTSLKDVIAITKDLLEIRNSEIKHLEERMKNMEERLKAEKEHHMLVLKRAETGQSINNDLKTEYEGQLKLFKDLREMYEKRVQALVTENASLKDVIAATKQQQSSDGSAPS